MESIPDRAQRTGRAYKKYYGKYGKYYSQYGYGYGTYGKEAAGQFQRQYPVKIIHFGYNAMYSGVQGVLSYIQYNRTFWEGRNLL